MNKSIKCLEAKNTLKMLFNEDSDEEAEILDNNLKAANKINEKSTNLNAKINNLLQIDKSNENRPKDCEEIDENLIFHVKKQTNENNINAVGKSSNSIKSDMGKQSLNTLNNVSGKYMNTKKATTGDKLFSLFNFEEKEDFNKPGVSDKADKNDNLNNSNSNLHLIPGHDTPNYIKTQVSDQNINTQNLLMINFEEDKKEHEQMLIDLSPNKKLIEASNKNQYMNKSLFDIFTNKAPAEGTAIRSCQNNNDLFSNQANASKLKKSDSEPQSSMDFLLSFVENNKRPNINENISINANILSDGLNKDKTNDVKINQDNDLIDLFTSQDDQKIKDNIVEDAAKATINKQEELDHNNIYNNKDDNDKDKKLAKNIIGNISASADISQGENIKILIESNSKTQDDQESRVKEKDRIFQQEIIDDIKSNNENKIKLINQNKTEYEYGYMNENIKYEEINTTRNNRVNLIRNSTDNIPIMDSSKFNIITQKLVFEDQENTKEIKKEKVSANNLKKKVINFDDPLNREQGALNNKKIGDEKYKKLNNNKKPGFNNLTNNGNPKSSKKNLLQEIDADIEENIFSNVIKKINKPTVPESDLAIKQEDQLSIAQDDIVINNAQIAAVSNTEEASIIDISSNDLFNKSNLAAHFKAKENITQINENLTESEYNSYENINNISKKEEGLNILDHSHIPEEDPTKKEKIAQSKDEENIQENFKVDKIGNNNQNIECNPNCLGDAVASLNLPSRNERNNEQINTEEKRKSIKVNKFSEIQKLLAMKIPKKMNNQEDFFIPKKPLEIPEQTENTNISKNIGKSTEADIINSEKTDIHLDIAVVKNKKKPMPKKFKLTNINNSVDVNALIPETIGEKAFNQLLVTANSAEEGNKDNKKLIADMKESLSKRLFSNKKVEISKKEENNQVEIASKELCLGNKSSINTKNNNYTVSIGDITNQKLVEVEKLNVSSEISEAQEINKISSTLEVQNNDIIGHIMPITQEEYVQEIKDCEDKNPNILLEDKNDNYKNPTTIFTNNLSENSKVDSENNQDQIMNKKEDENKITNDLNTDSIKNKDFQDNNNNYHNNSAEGISDSKQNSGQEIPINYKSLRVEINEMHDNEVNLDAMKSKKENLDSNEGKNKNSNNKSELEINKPADKKEIVHIVNFTNNEQNMQNELDSNSIENNEVFNLCSDIKLNMNDVNEDTGISAKGNQTNEVSNDFKQENKTPLKKVATIGFSLYEADEEVIAAEERKSKELNAKKKDAEKLKALKNKHNKNFNNKANNKNTNDFADQLRTSTASRGAKTQLTFDDE